MKVIAYANIPYGYTIHPVYLQVLVYDMVLGQGLKGKTPEEHIVLNNELLLKNTLAHVKTLGGK